MNISFKGKGILQHLNSWQSSAGTGAVSLETFPVLLGLSRGRSEYQLSVPYTDTKKGGKAMFHNSILASNSPWITDCHPLPEHICGLALSDHIAASRMPRAIIQNSRALFTNKSWGCCNYIYLKRVWGRKNHLTRMPNSAMRNADKIDNITLGNKKRFIIFQRV